MARSKPKPAPKAKAIEKVAPLKYADTAAVVADRCLNCGREGTLVKRTSCSSCGHTRPA